MFPHIPASSYEAVCVGTTRCLTIYCAGRSVSISALEPLVFRDYKQHLARERENGDGNGRDPRRVRMHLLQHIRRRDIE